MASAISKHSALTSGVLTAANVSLLIHACDFLLANAEVWNASRVFRAARILIVLVSLSLGSEDSHMYFLCTTGPKSPFRVILILVTSVGVEEK